MHIFTDSSNSPSPNFPSLPPSLFPTPHSSTKRTHFCGLLAAQRWRNERHIDRSWWFRFLVYFFHLVPIESSQSYTFTHIHTCIGWHSWSLADSSPHTIHFSVLMVGPFLVVIVTAVIVIVVLVADVAVTLANGYHDQMFSVKAISFVILTNVALQPN